MKSFSFLRLIIVTFLTFILAACGGGDEEIQTEAPSTGVVGITPVTPTPSVITNPSPVVTTPVTTNPPVVVVPVIPVVTTPVTPVVNTTCLPGSGVDYQVGVGKAYTDLDQVPWEALKAGDTVRIFYSSTPYKGKFLIGASGTAAAPVRICGVKGSGGERPIIEGAGAATRSSLLLAYGSTPDVQAIHQDRTIIAIKALSTDVYTATPSYIKIDGLEIRKGHPNYTYTDASGSVRQFAPFGACIWVDRGHNITIQDNVISDCQMAVFSKSTDDGDFAVTKNLAIVGNYMHGHGIVGVEQEHTTYTQSDGVLIENNHYGPLRPGALGNSVKDRSVGLVVRYNLIEEGARAIDMVEAEDFPIYAQSKPAYRQAFVYGNQIRKTGDTGSFIHYGGDHFGAPVGANWGEALFRRGTLYFFNNTIHAKGLNAKLFQISTTLETAEVWNNAFWFDDGMVNMNMRQAENDSLSTNYTGDGIVNLGKNWIRQGWLDADIYHTLKGQLNGQANVVTGSVIPFDATTFVPLSFSPLVDSAQAQSGTVAGHPLNSQRVGGTLAQRNIVGAGSDIGAVER